MKENFSIIDDDKIFVHHLSSVQFLGSVNQVQANKSAPSLVPGINKLSQHSQPLSQHLSRYPRIFQMTIHYLNENKQTVLISNHIIN